jgi:hypothetical protein
VLVVRVVCIQARRGIGALYAHTAEHVGVGTA